MITHAMFGGLKVLVDPSGEGPGLYSDPPLILSYPLSDKILFLSVSVVLRHLKRNRGSVRLII